MDTAKITRKDYKSYNEGQSNTVLSVFLLFDEFGVGNCKIELVEHFPCNSRNELERREGYHIQTNECVNKYIAGRTSKEYYEQYKATIITRVQDYYQRNREHILTKQKEHHQLHPEKKKDYGKQYYKENKEHKGRYRQYYYESHKDKCLEYGKNYREKYKELLSDLKRDYYIRNKQKILERSKIRVCCDICGGIFGKSDKTKHERTKKHQEALETKTEP